MSREGEREREREREEGGERNGDQQKELIKHKCKYMYMHYLHMLKQKIITRYYSIQKISLPAG